MLRKMGKEEARLVQKAVEAEMEKVRSGKVKTYSLEEVLKELEVDDKTKKHKNSSYGKDGLKP